MTTTTPTFDPTITPNTEAAKSTPCTLTIASHEWATRPCDQRYASLDELHEAVSRRRELSREAVVSLRDITADVFEDGLRVMLEGEEPGRPTNWSTGQLARAADFRVTELRKLSPKLAADVINEQIAKQDNAQVKIMRVLAGEDEQQDVIQAFTGPSYGRIFDADVTEMIKRVVEMSGGRFYNPRAYANGEFGAEPVPSGLYASDRDVFAFMIDGGSIFDAGERAQLNKGFIVANSEVGKSALTIMSFYFNVVCGNHLVWGAHDINMKRIVHSSGAPGRFAADAFDELMKFTQGPVDLDPIRRTQEIKLTDIRPGSHDFDTERDKWIKAFGERYGFTSGEIKGAIGAAIREEGKVVTLWDLIQGFTASARTIPHTDTRLAFELRVGKLVDLGL